MYDWLKEIALTILPAIGTFYGALATIWGFPYGEEVVKTIIAVDTLLGVIVKVLSVIYNKNQEAKQIGGNNEN